MQPLAARTREIDGTDLSRFLPPADGTGRQSAVLMTFADTRSGPAVLLLQRAADMRKHPGQVAFPGGALDPGESPAQAAVREAGEEVGLDPESVQVVAEFPAVFIPVTQFVVTPVLAWWTHPHEVSAVDAAEVARVALVPVVELADPRNRFVVTHPSGFMGPAFEAGGLFVWGFTAGLVDRLLTFGGWARPWDQDVRRPLPPALMGR